ncbi:MAG: DNA mismatch repair endonuclease MutL [Verrucomicrobiota bacterium]|jgi:DNA mismatch repair protein MutL|nr:DNA mismatch repair endonuclease MutL [Verrucomicrobiota bacterium]
MTTPASIRLLPDHVINQIAAGEVVDRPASVMKELLENALDAGATHIEVDVVDGGRRLVRIVDNGSGMDRENALLSIERHATSKLRELKDLDTIGTLGFRGEALAAIASVSQFTLVTQPEGAAAGTEILMFGGKLQDVRDAGAPKGTDVAVRNLFFNVPARRKFLRSAPTEFTHIRQTFLLEALSHVEVEFVLRADETEVYRLPSAADLTDRIRDIYGGDMVGHLRPMNFGNGVVEVGGYAGAPPFSRMDREWQVVFINGRPASSPVVNFAIQSAYRDVLPGGRYAPLFLNIQVPPEMVDVNIHPAKKEVRFRRPTEVRDVIVEAIRLAIVGTAPATAKRGMPPRSSAGASNTAVSAPPPPSAPVAPPVVAGAPGMQRQADLSFAPPVPPPSPSPPGAVAVASSSAPWRDYRLLGRVGGLYVVLETAEGLVLLDPRSAHERVLYERFLHGLEEGRVPSQGLLKPVPAALSPAQMTAVRKHLPLLRQLGFGMEEFGGDTVLLDALPVWLADVEPAALVSDLADGLLQGARPSAQEWAKPFLADLSGRQAVALRRELADPELHALIRDLSRTDMPYTSPAGKPTVVLIGLRELNRKFARE